MAAAAAANTARHASSSARRIKPVVLHMSAWSFLGCGPALIRDADADQADDLAAVTRIELFGGVAEGEEVEAAVKIPRSEVAGDPAERQGHQRADVEEAE